MSSMKYKTVLVTILLLAVVVLSACSSDAAPAEEAMPENNAMDTNDNGVDDIQVEADADGDVEVTIDMDDVAEDVDEVPVDEFCVPGSTYTYDSAEGSVDAEVIGLTTYKGSEFCQAQSTTTISANGMDIMTDTTYYYDNTFNEYWIVTTVSSDMMPEPQTTEIHLVDGEIQ